MTLNSTLSCPLVRPLAAVLLAAGTLACTINKDLATGSDADPSMSGAEASTGTGEPTTAGTADESTTGSTGFQTPGVSSTGPDDAGDESSTGEPVLGCPDHPAIDDCCCFTREDEEDAPLELVCPEGPELCERSTLECPPEMDCIGVSDEALVDCALSALKGQTPGKIHVHINIDDDTQRDIFYHIVGDGTVFRIDTNSFDFMGTVDTGRFTLQSPDVFDACLMGSLAEKADCLIEAVIGASEEICVPQFGFDDV